MGAQITFAFGVIGSITLNTRIHKEPLTGVGSGRVYFPRTAWGARPG